jgi:FkbM family methyltransferase
LREPPDHLCRVYSAVVTLLHRARRVVQSVGIDVCRFPDNESGYHRAKLLAHHEIDHVFDVGASDGRFGAELRRFGYRGRIVSFEPLPDAYAKLADRASDDSRWTTVPYALGSESGEVVLNVAGNSGASSSILPMLDRHMVAAPEAGVVATETVQQHRLDEVWRDFAPEQSRLFLKVDVQGYEQNVLAGARELLNHCSGVQLELSFVPLYEGSMSYRGALDEMERLGLTLMLLDPGFRDRMTGQVLQADAAFFRTPS